jgi:hypothetical protein
VLSGTLTLEVGEPAETCELPIHSIVIVAPRTPIRIANDGSDELLLFIYGAPSGPSAEIIEPIGPEVQRVITSEDVR